MTGGVSKLHTWLRAVRVRRVRNQILLMTIGIVLVVCALTSVAIYTQAKLRFESIYAEINSSNLVAYSELLTLKLNPLIQSVRKAVYSDAFISALRTPGQALSARLEDSPATRTLKQALSFLAQEEASIVDLLLFDNQNRFLYASSEAVRDYQQFYTTAIERDEPWYRAALEAQGLEVFFGRNVVTNGRERISYVKSIRDPNGLEQLAVLVVVLNASILNDVVFEWDTSQKSHVMMVVDDQKQSAPLLLSPANEASEGIFAQYLTQRSDGDYIYLTERNERTGWLFVNAIRKNDLNSLSGYFITGAMSFLTLILLGGSAASVLVSSHISKPLHKLKQTICQFGADRQPIVADFDDSEIGSIGQTFKKTMNENLELTRRMTQLQIREKEAEYQMLQAQINPHFLYNALDSLYFMAVLHNVDDIAEMTSALSDIFKITLNKGGNFLTLGEELDYIRKYMLIQNVRFSGRIALRVDCPEPLPRCRVLKFLIQPFVENAVCHGCEPKIGPCGISVVCRREGDALLVFVEDDGIGIADLSGVRSGYGINNVCERIRLLYGDDYGVTIQSEAGVGTRVALRLPYRVETEPDIGA